MLFLFSNLVGDFFSYMTIMQVQVCSIAAADPPVWMCQLEQFSAWTVAFH